MKTRTLGILCLILLLGAAGNLRAQGGTLEIPLVTMYDLDSTVPIYCATTGVSGVLSPGHPMPEKVLTVGSSTTITAVAPATTAPFTLVAAGDYLEFVIKGVKYYRVVMTRTSADEVVVDTAIDLSAIATGYPFTYRVRACGTTIADGWFPVAGYKGLTALLQIGQMVLTAPGYIDFYVQCRAMGADNDPIDIYSPNTILTYRVGGYTAVQTQNDAVAVDLTFGNFAECRVGSMINGADDAAGDAAANMEQITTKAILRN